MREATEEQKRAVLEKLNACSHYIGRRTVTFHWEDEERVPRQNGTGVLLRIAHRRFIITGAHVADQIKAKFDSHELTFIAGCGNLEKPPIPLDRVVLLLSPSEGKNRKWQDLYDVAVVELLTRATNELAGHSTFVELDQLDLAVEQNDGGHFYIFGFTSGSNQADRERRTLTTTAFPIATQLFRGDLSSLLSFDPGTGLLFDFDAHAGGGEGSPRVAPRLGGISGCGIWRIVSADRQFMECDPAKAKLVAIEHEEVVSSKAIAGTRIKYALQMIFRNYADLRDAITAVFPSLD
jgi:hypothetical protein